MLHGVSGRVCGNRLGLALSVLGFVACNTYDDSLLVGSLGSSVPADGGSSNGGTSGAAASGGRAQPGGAGQAEVSDAGSSAEGGAAGQADDGSAGNSSGGQSGTVSGGAAGGAGTAGSAIGAGAGGGTVTGNLELIDDFEDQDSFVLLSHQRNGPWYTFSDATAGKVNPVTIALLMGTNAHDSSSAALHLVASGFSDWGAGVGCDLVNQQAKKVAYDVSAYKGVHFYAKVASGSPTALKLLVPTTYSDPDGGKCTDTVSTKRCNDHLFYPLSSLKTSWATYDVLFADLVQQGFGLVQSGLDPASVYSLQFTLPTKLMPVDLWLDDVSFILK
jgi:hypothetical protein